jgi:3-oxoacid CoA-transferase subunit A
MYKNILITGDTHGRVYERLADIPMIYKAEETAVIILGDAGFNFYLNRTDERNKNFIQETGFHIYCVRGNHEERPENIPTMIEVYDNDMCGLVYMEKAYPNIRYFKDGDIYNLNGYKTLVIGGAYSVDKWHRLNRAKPGAKWTGWFKDEQLTSAEMENISKECAGQYFDFILSHTCPYSWQPFDLFLSGIDQNTVDNSMERWLDIFKDTITWNVWLFGHFHDDRQVCPSVEMFYKDIKEIDTIFNEQVCDYE